jgi:hypothetical protein
LFIGGLVADLIYIPPAIIDDLAIGSSGPMAQQTRIGAHGRRNVRAS